MVLLHNITRFIRNNKGTMLLIIFIQLTEKSTSRNMRWSKEFIMLAPLILCAILFMKYFIINKKNINTKSLIYSLVIMLSLFLTMVINQDFANDNFFLLTTVTTGFVLSNLYTRENFLNSFSKAILFYSVYSLIATYLINPIIINNNMDIFPIYENHLNTPFTDYGFAYVVRWFGFRRNQGYFTEPGVFQFYVFIALFIELFYFKRKNKIPLIVFFITIVSTFSTIALLGLVPLLVLYVLHSYKIKMRYNFFIVIFGVSIAMYLFNNSEVKNLLNYSIVEKFSGLEGESFTVRFESIINLLKTIIQNPLVGSSFVNGIHYIQENYMTYDSGDLTGTIFVFFMGLGIPIGTLLLWNFSSFCKILTHRNRVIFMVVFFVLFLSINTQNLVYDIILMMLLYLPFMKERNEYG